MEMYGFSLGNVYIKTLVDKNCKFYEVSIK